MKKTILLVVTGIVATIIINATIQSTQIAATSSQSPGGYTGSTYIDNGADCSSCHSSPSTFRTGMVTGNIPNSGYIPGTTYTLYATVSESGRSKFGFELVAVKGFTGKNAGKLIVTNTSQNRLITVGGYERITHTSNGTVGNGTKKWTFNWTAPAKGTGNVSFYSAYNAANGDGSTGGDLIIISNTVVEEDISSGIDENEVASFKAYPNPASNTLFVGENVSKITLTDLTGKTIATIVANKGKASLADVESGIYLLSGYNGDVVVLSQKLVVEH